MAKWSEIGLGLLGISASLSALSLAQGLGLSVNAQSTPAPAPTTSPILVKPTPNASESDRVTTGLLKLAEITSDDIVYILGDGDGQLAIAATQQSQPRRVVVIEPDAGRLKAIQAQIQQAGAGDLVQFLQQDPATADIKVATVVILTLPSEAAQKLRPKLLAELRPGTRIVSYAAPLGDWKPDKNISISRSAQPNLYHWIVPANIEGDWSGSLEYAPGRRYPYTLRFSQQFQKVKGDVIVDGQKYAIPKIALVGDRLTFSRTEDIQGQTMTAVFNGRIQGNTLKGIAELEAGILSRKFPVIAKRSK